MGFGKFPLEVEESRHVGKYEVDDLDCKFVCNSMNKIDAKRTSETADLRFAASKSGQLKMERIISVVADPGTHSRVNMSAIRMNGDHQEETCQKTWLMLRIRLGTR